MLRADVCMDILENLSRNDMDTLFVTNRQVGSLSRRLARRMTPRQVSIHHYHEGQFHLRFDAIERVVAFDDFSRYLEGSQLTDVELLATMLDANTQRALALCKTYFYGETRLSVSCIRASNEAVVTAAFGDTLTASRMRLHVSPDALDSNLLRWPGVERCSDLYVTLTNDHVAPEWALQWLVAEKTREGPLRLRVHTNRRESWHRHWEVSAQRLLLRITESEHRYPSFDCHFSFMGARGHPRTHRVYHPHNPGTGRKFIVQELTRTSFIGCMEHIVRFSCA